MFKVRYATEEEREGERDRDGERERDWGGGDGNQVGSASVAPLSCSTLSTQTCLAVMQWAKHANLSRCHAVG